MLRSALIFAIFSVILVFFVINIANGKVIYETREEGYKQKIVGGSKTYIFWHPYQVIVKNNDKICGGTILTEFHILTAAHCVSGTKENYVVSGAAQVDLGRGIKVEKSWIHPEYNSQNTLNNIAVLKLSEPIKFDESRQPARLPTHNVRKGDIANVTGYGVENIGADIADNQLQVTTMQVWHQKYCKFLAGDNRICGVNQPGIGVCVGDGGGPLAIGNTVIGVVSHAFGSCANGLPQVFTNVFKYLSFIYEAISKT